jgi:CHAT domain-containing protein
MMRRVAGAEAPSVADRNAERRLFRDAFVTHVALLDDEAARNPSVKAANIQEAFLVGQVPTANETADQLALMIARGALGADKSASLVSAFQEALARERQAAANFAKAAAFPSEEQNEQTDRNVREALAQAEEELAQLNARMERELPAYRDLINPQPLRLDEAQRLLNADEALIHVLVGDEGLFVWVVRRSEVFFHRSSMGASAIDKSVKRLRSQLDLGAGDPAVTLSRPFDVATAYDLYREMLAPAEPILEGVRHLIIVPDGALRSLPFGVLVSERPTKASLPLAELRRVPWLAKRWAVTTLPSVNALRGLRVFAQNNQARDPFIGFGDPLLGGSAEVRRSKIAALYSRSSVADTQEVRKLPRLPETADELKAIAAATKATPGTVHLAQAATEQRVKQADLTRYRTLVFATHGLVAGDFRELAEPALVLTPPAHGSELDDGLLTASEVSQLKLNADWVILSACNTAAPDGTPGAEGLSGLAKAFFYAGARSLLVSHWAVSSEATVALTTRMFVEKEKGVSKAEALRRSMLALMQTPGKPLFAHPAFWAPFVVVGEGGADTRR